MTHVVRADDAAAEAGASRDDAVAVVRRLQEAGHVALFAGGCVRDELLGIAPDDYDVATDAPPGRVRDIFGRRYTREVGAAFGVILVREGASQVEVATFRSDGEYRDGRRPESVTFGNAEHDARRRDFTLNGLFRDPLADAADPRDDGIIDHVGGRRDLRDRVLRCIGDPYRRFEEDYLRLLRAVRFAARFGLAIEPATWRALCDAAPRIAAVTPERVGDELRRMLAPPTRGEAWRLLWESRLLAFAFGDDTAELETDRHRPFTRHVAGLEQTVSVSLAVAATVLDLAVAAGLPPTLAVQPRQAAALITRAREVLRLSNGETEALLRTLDLTPLLRANVGVAALRRFLASPHAADARVLLEALKNDRDLGRAASDVLARLDAVASSTSDLAPPPWVTGDDLLAAGVVPGPVFKRALAAAYDAQLDGTADDAADALAVALRVAAAG